MIGGRDALGTAGETPALQNESAIHEPDDDPERGENRNYSTPKAIGSLNKLDTNFADAGVDGDEDFARVRLTLRGDCHSIYFDSPGGIVEQA